MKLILKCQFYPSVLFWEEWTLPGIEPHLLFLTRFAPWCPWPMQCQLEAVISSPENWPP